MARSGSFRFAEANIVGIRHSDRRMPVTAILKKKIFWLVVFGIGITTLIPCELFTHGAGYTPLVLGLVLLMLGLGLVLVMLVLHLLSMFNPYGYLLLLGVVATLIIERLIGAYEKNKSPVGPLPPQEPDFSDNET